MERCNYPCKNGNHARFGSWRKFWRLFCAARAGVSGIIVIAVRKDLSHPGPERGAVYRDLDGQLVRLVKVTKHLCTWLPVAQREAAREVTHRDYFLRRFKPLKKYPYKTAA